MALQPANDVANTNPANAAYPQGSAKNVSVAGAGDGTPWEENVVNDIWGFLQSLLDQGSVVPNNAPDSVTNQQYVEALINFMASRTAVGNSNDFNMGAYGSVLVPDNTSAKINIAALAQEIEDIINGVTTVGSAINATTLQGQTLSYVLNLSNSTGTLPGSSVADASDTVKGVVESSTDVEVNAGAFNGGTGAVLATSPGDIFGGNLLAGRSNTSTTNGYVTEGLIQSSSRLRWQRGAVAGIVINNGAPQSGTIVYPLAFTTIVYGVWICAYSIGGSRRIVGNVTADGSGTLNLTDFEWTVESVTGAGTSLCRMTWLAYGK